MIVRAMSGGREPRRGKNRARFVDSLGGRYVTAEDVGISVDDVDTMARATRHVAGTRAGGAGDPSPSTAYGVLMGIRAAVTQAIADDLDAGQGAVLGKDLHGTDQDFQLDALGQGRLEVTLHPGPHHEVIQRPPNRSREVIEAQHAQAHT